MNVHKKLPAEYRDCKKIKHLPSLAHNTDATKFCVIFNKFGNNDKSLQFKNILS